MARILILGGGYGGLRTAFRLHSLLHRNGDHEITLVDQSEFHQIIVRLHEVAAASIDCPDVLVPFGRLLQGKAIRFLNSVVTGIDLAERRVSTSTGVVNYDKLVIALGSETNFFGIPGLKESSLELKSYQDASRLRHHVEQLFVAAKDESNADRRRELLTIVIGGGGFTGIELAGELADFRDDLSERYDIDPAETRLTIVDAKDVLLGGFDPVLAEKARRTLVDKRVELLLGRGAASIQDGAISLTTGQTIQTKTLIWTGGVKAPRLLSTLGLQTGAAGRLVINPYAEAIDCPGVYPVGDCALVLDPKTGRPIAPSAQLALQQGSLVAYNINAEIRDLPRRNFTPKIVAEIVSLGRNNAIGLIGPYRLSGLLPSLLKKAASYRYLYSIGGLSLVVEKLGLNGQTFTKLARTSKHSSLSNRKGAQ